MTKTFSMSAVALLAAMAATSAQACPDCASKQAQATAAPSTSTSDALRVVIDRETGQLRAPTAAEINASSQRALAATSARIGGAQSPSQPLVKTHAGGAKRVRVTDEFQSHSVAVIRADGTLETQCYENKAAALSAMKSAKSSQAVAALETE